LPNGAVLLHHCQSTGSCGQEKASPEDCEDCPVDHEFDVFDVVKNGILMLKASGHVGVYQYVYITFKMTTIPMRILLVEQCIATQNCQQPVVCRLGSFPIRLRFLGVHSMLTCGIKYLYLSDSENVHSPASALRWQSKFPLNNAGAAKDEPVESLPLGRSR